jgi:hypothetical protein
LPLGHISYTPLPWPNGLEMGAPKGAHLPTLSTYGGCCPPLQHIPPIGWAGAAPQRGHPSNTIPQIRGGCPPSGNPSQHGVLCVCCPLGPPKKFWDIPKHFRNPLKNSRCTSKHFRLDGICGFLTNFFGHSQTLSVFSPKHFHRL